MKESKNARITKKNKRRMVLLSKCAVPNNKKSRFIKQQADY